MKPMEIETWGDLGSVIASMTDEQKRMPVQCVLTTPDGDAVQELLPSVAIGSVAEFEFEACRSVHNNKYCPDDLVLLLDHNSFAEDGAVAYEWTEDDRDIPIYGKDGPTSPDEQVAPRQGGQEQ